MSSSLATGTMGLVLPHAVFWRPMQQVVQALFKHQQCLPRRLWVLQTDKQTHTHMLTHTFSLSLTLTPLASPLSVICHWLFFIPILFGYHLILYCCIQLLCFVFVSDLQEVCCYNSNVNLFLYI